MRRLEQIKSRKRKSTEEHSDRVHTKPDTCRRNKLIHETTSLVRVIDHCLARERPSSLAR